MFGCQFAQGLGLDRRRIAVKDDQASAGALQHVARAFDRMAGAALLRLHDEAQLFGGGAERGARGLFDFARLMADDHEDVFRG